MKTFITILCFCTTLVGFAQESEKEISVTASVAYETDMKEYLLGITFDLERNYNYPERFSSIEELIKAYQKLMQEKGIKNTTLINASSKMLPYVSAGSDYYTFSTNNIEDLEKIKKINFPMARVGELYGRVYLSDEDYNQYLTQCLAMAKEKAEVVAGKINRQLGEINSISVDTGSKDALTGVRTFDYNVFRIYVNYSFY